MTGEASASTRHLLARVELVARRVRGAVARRRHSDPEPDDPVRGLYVSESEVDRLLTEGPLTLGLEGFDAERLRAVEDQADTAEGAGELLRLRQLQRAFDLDDLDVELLLISLAPDVDPRYERLYGYLHDDVTRLRASVALALELAGLPLAAPSGRSRLMTTSRLAAGGLIDVEETERPLLTRALRVPDRVTGFLLGEESSAPEVDAIQRTVEPMSVPGVDRLRRSLAAGIPLCYLREPAGASGVALAVAALQAADLPRLVVDLGIAVGREDLDRTLRAAVREARLRDVTLVAGSLDALAEVRPSGIRVLADAPVQTVLVGDGAWDPGWTDQVPLQVEVERPVGSAREQIWREALGAAGLSDAVDLPMGQFRVTPDQALRAARSASLRADQRPVRLDDLRAGAREQNAGRLEHLARRIEPRAGFEDLVLPPRVLELLREIVDRAKHRDRVLGEWGMGGRADRGQGITSLFAGESGTGKTLSAEVVAGALGLDLYTIDLSTVVDKYIGETEKNLERIFDEAEGVNAILFFDEADALFGKRSEVSDARDRYANVEIAFLLQRMEHFDGIAVLATNLRANLDEAFTRRIDVLADFPTPDEQDRLRLWELHLPSVLPRGDDLDLDYLAKAFEVAGGDIRNITVAAAYAAATEDEPLTMRHLIQATAREYRKLGRLCTESEFGPYLELIVEPSAQTRAARTEGRTGHGDT